MAAAFTALVFLLLSVFPAADAARPEPRRLEAASSARNETTGVPELPGDVLNPVMLAAIGSYLLTGGLALLLLKR